MPSSAIKRAVLAVCLVSLFTVPSAFGSWGPVGIPPLGTAREIDHFDCSTGMPSLTGVEYWDCDRSLYQFGSPSNYAMAFDFDCITNEEGPVTYWCKRSNGTWRQLTRTEFSNCESCD